WTPTLTIGVPFQVGFLIFSGFWLGSLRCDLYNLPNWNLPRGQQDCPRAGPAPPLGSTDRPDSKRPNRASLRRARRSVGKEPAMLWQPPGLQKSPQLSKNAV